MKQDKTIDILPAIQQQHVRSGPYSEMKDTSESASEAEKNSDLADAQQPEMISSSVPYSINSIFLQRAKDAGAREPAANNGSPFQPSHLIGSASHGRLYTSTNRGHMNEVGSITKTLKFGEGSTPFKDLDRARGNSQLKGKRTEEPPHKQMLITT